MTLEKTTTQHRRLKGVVVSNASDKTIVVRVDRTVLHSKYGKRYIRSSRYHVHDEQNTHNVGDQVLFEESRPYSRLKRWRVVREA